MKSVSILLDAWLHFLYTNFKLFWFWSKIWTGSWEILWDLPLQMHQKTLVTKQDGCCWRFCWCVAWHNHSSLDSYALPGTTAAEPVNTSLPLLSPGQTGMERAGNKTFKVNPTVQELSENYLGKKAWLAWEINREYDPIDKHDNESVCRYLLNAADGY